MLRLIKNHKVLATIFSLILILSLVAIPNIRSGIDNALQSTTTEIKKCFTIGTVEAAIVPDYICDGTDDDVQFQNALNALPTIGGKLDILAGHYLFNATVSRPIDNVMWSGCGQSTNLTYDNSTTLISVGTQSGWVFEDLAMDAGGIEYSLAANYYIQNVSVDSILVEETGFDTSLVLDEKPFVGGSAPADTFVDRSRWGNNGVHTDITWVQLPSGIWVRSFNGSTSKIEIPYDSSLNMVTGYTVEQWLYPTDSASEHNVAIIDGGTAGWTQQWGISYSVDALHYRSICNFGGAPLYMDALTYKAINTWSHVVTTYDKANVKLYLDGELDNSAAKTDAIGTVAESLWMGILNTVHLWVGRQWGARIYSRALSATDVAKKFEAERAWFGV